MIETVGGRELMGRRATRIALAVVLAAGALIYTAGVPHTPPGFYIDESSIAYNAHLIARTGRDEHGARFPLFFRAFGEYKNPVHVYLLSALFLITGPSIAAARMLSALMGLAACLALGLLGYRLTGRRDVGLLTALTALLTPWLFELSRLVFEVALFPLALALYLPATLRASDKERWSLADAALPAASLALLTYTYSVGRLLAPLLAVGLLIFVRRAGFASITRVWLLYALSLLPLVIFHFKYPGALFMRFRVLTYLSTQSSPLELAGEFTGRYLANLNPWRLLVTGDPATLIASVNGAGQVLAATFVLALIGAALVLRTGVGRKTFWLYVLYGLAVAPVPASLTIDDFHLLRLAAVPVFLVVLSVPGLAWLMKNACGEEGARRRGLWRVALTVVFALTILQGAAFLRLYHSEMRTKERREEFDADYYTSILRVALERPERPIYLADAPAIPGYIQAYWHSTLRSIPRAGYARLAPATPAPEGALVITTEESTRRCRPLAESEPYTVCLMEGPPAPPAPLPSEGFRAEIIARRAPERMRAKEKEKIVVRLRNAGVVVWRARERAASPYQIAVTARWLDGATGAVVAADDRAAIPHDLAPGEEAEITLTVNAPKRAGEYRLELDLIQEGVSRFGARDSQAILLPVKIER